MAVDPTTIIEQALADPQSISADGVTAVSRSADDALKLVDRLLYERAAAANHNFGIRRTQMVPPGPVNVPGPQINNFNQGLI